jgi:hypothetical protein
VTTAGELLVAERGRPLAFTFDDMLRYHGGGSPGGVAHAFKVLERALPVLSPDRPAERRAITVRTAFGGPGARDGIELVTRAVSEGRYVVDAALARPERGLGPERLVFVVGLGDASVTLAVRDGIVPDEFIAMARREGRTADEEALFDRMKAEMAERVMSLPAPEVYEMG